ncbi:MAG: TonB C-terminal domain-containing protein [Vampirovibrionales bacterium]|nr:TonB C-terminal domain-containing protein [Vampirovibrionales bacterium]
MLPRIKKIYAPTIILTLLMAASIPVLAKYKSPYEAVSSTQNTSTQRRSYKPFTNAFEDMECPTPMDGELLKRLNSYKHSVQKQVFQYWKVPSDYSGRMPVMLIKVDRLGKVTAFDVIRTSGNVPIDSAIRETLMRELPSVTSPPIGFIGDTVTIELIYDVIEFYTTHSEDEQTALMSVYQTPEVDRWLKKVTYLSQKAWKPPAYKNIKEVVVLVTIDTQDGSIIHYEFTQFSCVPMVDKSVLDAINQAAPYPTLKINYPMSAITVELVFEHDAYTPIRKSPWSF